MWAMILIFLVAFGLFSVFLKKSLDAMARYVGRTTNRRHHDAEYILEHRTPPPAWKERLRKHQPEKAAIRDLDALIRYFTNAPVFESEETRLILIGDLKKIHGEWEQRIQEGTPIDL